MCPPRWSYIAKLLPHQHEPEMLDSRGKPSKVSAACKPPKLRRPLGSLVPSLGDGFLVSPPNKAGQTGVSRHGKAPLLWFSASGAKAFSPTWLRLLGVVEWMPMCVRITRAYFPPIHEAGGKRVFLSGGQKSNISFILKGRWYSRTAYILSCLCRADND